MAYLIYTSREKVDSLVKDYDFGLRNVIHLVDKRRQLCIRYNGGFHPFFFDIMNTENAKHEIERLEEKMHDGSSAKNMIKVRISNKKFNNIYRNLKKQRWLSNRFYEMTNKKPLNDLLTEVKTIINGIYLICNSPYKY
jgi:hypothetical protein